MIRDLPSAVQARRIPRDAFEASLMEQLLLQQLLGRAFLGPEVAPGLWVAYWSYESQPFEESRALEPPTVEAVAWLEDRCGRAVGCWYMPKY